MIEYAVPGCGPAPVGDLFPNFLKKVLPLPLRVYSHNPEERNPWKLPRFISNLQKILYNVLTRKCFLAGVNLFKVA
jgi:hypothetical protein